MPSKKIDAENENDKNKKPHPAIGFIDFIRKQGIVGLAVGFILGGSLSGLVSAFVNDLINPLLSLVFSRTGELKTFYLSIGAVKLMWGDFLATVINFLVIALVVYGGVKLLGIEKLDKPKQ